MAAAPVIDPILGIAPGVSSRSAQVQAYYTEILASSGASIANGWMTYAATHTNLDAATALQEYADNLAAEGLGASVGAATGATGSAINQITTGTVAGADQIAKNPVSRALGTVFGAVDAVPKFLSMLTSGNLWMRVGEVVAGLILFGIGVNALFHGKPMAAVTGTAGKLAPLAGA